MKEIIYLDYNATTPIDPQVADAMRPFLDGFFGNPSSSHWFGIAPKRAVEVARRQVADLLDCSPAEIVFTSGGTESNNHAIAGIARAMQSKGNHECLVILPLRRHGRLPLQKDLEGAARPEDQRPHLLRLVRC